MFYTHEFPPCKAGAATFAATLANSLTRNKDNSVTVLAPRYSGQNALFNKRQTFKVMRLFLNSATIINYLTGFVGFLYSLFYIRPDYILLTDIMSQRVASIVSFLIRRKYIVVAHGSEVLANFKEGAFKRKIFAEIYSRACGIIANSNYTRDLLVESGVAPDKITVINPAINPELLSRRGEPQRVIDRYNLKGKKVLLTVGSLSERKGHDKVIEALPYIMRKIKDLVYLVVGSGDNLDNLKKLARRHKVDNVVIFAGRVSDSDLIDYYDACNIFVLPNRQVSNLVEGFGIVFLEAAARRRPVIGGASGGTSDAVLNGSTGYLINPLDSRELAEAAIRLLEDEELASSMGRQGRERCCKYFSEECIGDKISRVIK